MTPIYTRCYICFERLFITDDYGDYNKWEVKNGQRVRKSEARWFDGDWVIAEHIRRNHK